MPYCANCGTQMSEQATTCPNCGHPHAGGPAATPVGAKRTEGTAVASLVLGIAGIFVCPLILSILAIYFGKQAQNKIRQDPALEGDGLANAGIVLGWVGIGLVALGLLIALFSVA